MEGGGGRGGSGGGGGGVGGGGRIIYHARWRHEIMNLTPRRRIFIVSPHSSITVEF